VLPVAPEFAPVEPAKIPVLPSYLQKEILILSYVSCTFTELPSLFKNVKYPASISKDQE
jgi:hypothetical protein